MSNLLPSKISMLQMKLPLAALCLIVSQVISPAHASAAISCAKILDGTKDVIPTNTQAAEAIISGKRTVKFVTGNLENVNIRDTAETLKPGYDSRFERKSSPDYRTKRQKEKAKKKQSNRDDEYRDSKGIEYKPERELRSERELLMESDADFIALQEIFRGNEIDQLLQEGVNNNLAEKYIKFQIQGNDSRGIEITMLAKRDLGFSYEYTTNKDLRWTDPKTGENIPLFSRDLPILKVKHPTTGKVVMIVIPVHPKSKRDREGDRESTRLRTAQLDKTAEIIQALQTQYGPRLRVVLLGDFQTDVTKGPELEKVREVTSSAFDVTKGKKIPVEERSSHTYFGDGGVERRPIDDVRVAGALLVEDAKYLTYKDEQGIPYPAPQSFKERSGQPSDHKPGFAEVRFEEE